MTPEAAEETLRNLITGREGATFELGRRNGVVRLRVSGSAGREAVISTPGDRWFSLDVEAGLSLDYFEEDAPDKEVAQRLSDYLGAALTYVAGGGDIERGRSGIKLIRVQYDGREFVLRRSIGTILSSVFRGGRKRLRGTR